MRISARLKHYLDALEIRTQAQKMAALFAGKAPHAASLVPGGATVKVTSLNLSQYRTLLELVQGFIDQSYLPDVIAVAGAFPEYFAVGRGCGNFLSYGVFPESADAGSKFLPAGVQLKGQWQPVDPEAIAEEVGQSRFSSGSGLQPFDGETVAAPEKNGAYSWLKAPRYHGEPMEVGPLARLLAASRPGGNPELKGAVDGLLKTIGRPATDLPFGHGAARDPRLGMQAGGGPLRRVAGSTQARRALLQGFFRSEHRPRLRTDRSGARCAGTLAGNQGQENQQLPVRGADDLELLAAR